MDTRLLGSLYHFKGWGHVDWSSLCYSEMSCLLRDKCPRRLHQQAVTLPLGRLKREDQQVSWCQPRAMSSTHNGSIRVWYNQVQLDQAQNRGCDKSCQNQAYSKSQHWWTPKPVGKTSNAVVSSWFTAWLCIGTQPIFIIFLINQWIIQPSVRQQLKHVNYLFIIFINM